MHPRTRPYPLPACSGPTPPTADRLTEIRDNLTARISEAEREGWLGEIEGLRAQPRRRARRKLTEIDRTRTSVPVDLGIPVRRQA